MYMHMSAKCFETLKSIGEEVDGRQVMRKSWFGLAVNGDVDVFVVETRPKKMCTV